MDFAGADLAMPGDYQKSGGAFAFSED